MNMNVLMKKLSVASLDEVPEGDQGAAVRCRPGAGITPAAASATS